MRVNQTTTPISTFSYRSKIGSIKSRINHDYYNNWSTIDWKTSYITNNNNEFKNSSTFDKAKVNLTKYFLLIIISLVFALISFIINKLELFLIYYKNHDNFPNHHFQIYFLSSIILASVSCLITLSTKIDYINEDADTDDEFDDCIDSTAKSGVPYDIQKSGVVGHLSGINKNLLSKTNSGVNLDKILKPDIKTPILSSILNLNETALFNPKTNDSGLKIRGREKLDTVYGLVEPEGMGSDSGAQQTHQKRLLSGINFGFRETMKSDSHDALRINLNLNDETSVFQIHESIKDESRSVTELRKKYDTRSSLRGRRLSNKTSSIGFEGKTLKVEDTFLNDEFLTHGRLKSIFTPAVSSTRLERMPSRTLTLDILEPYKSFNKGSAASSPIGDRKLRGSSNPQLPRVIYSAAGSGVPEVKTILSGFTITKFLGVYTLFAKSTGLILSIASGLCVGKEGPYVHLATCVGNIASRIFPSIHENDYTRKQILSAAASSGVALAFGSPLGGVIFILEEINNHLPSHHLFQIFFCTIMSVLFLKYLDPYGTGKTVLFELSYTSDWAPIELIFFIFLGISGGLFGASFIKFIKWWQKFFRSKSLIKKLPLVEVLFISAITAMITFWNTYTKLASTELVLELATSCGTSESNRSLCPLNEIALLSEIKTLLCAFIVKVLLTSVTFGIKVPSGIYIPSMVIGALYGRIFSMSIEYISLRLGWTYFCSENSTCVDFGIYAMIAAGAFMAAVTRMNITLVIILFELTSSYTYVLPISLAVAVANWSAGLIEPHSLYETLLIQNDYPFMSEENETVDPITTVGEILASVDIFEKNSTIDDFGTTNDIENKLYIDVTSSPFVSANTLMAKLRLLKKHHLLDGCLPLIKKNSCIGIMYFSDLKYSVDKLAEFTFDHDVLDEMYCMLVKEDEYDSGIVDYYSRHNEFIVRGLTNQSDDYFTYGSMNVEFDLLMEEIKAISDLTKLVDFSPIFLNYDSELSFAKLIFERVGNRVIVLTKRGKHYGILHKKALIDYIRNYQKV